MPFVQVETETDVTVPTALVEYMRPKPRKSKNGVAAKRDDYDRTKVKPRLIITIPTTICGTAMSERFILQRGTDADKRKARVVGADDGKGAIKPTTLMHSMVFKFGYVKVFGDEAAGAERMPVRRISAEIFEFDLPEWWV